MQSLDEFERRLRRYNRMCDRLEPLLIAPVVQQFKLDVPEMTEYAAHGKLYRSGAEPSLEETRELGHFPYIPFNLLEFARLIRRVGRRFPGRTFIDVGCGIGDKVFMADNDRYIKEAWGIEYNTENVRRARSFLTGHPTADRILCGDAFEHNFAPYGIIYMYHPIQRQDRMWSLFQHIASTAAEGTIVIEVLKSYFPIRYDYDDNHRDVIHSYPEEVFSNPPVGCVFQKIDGRLHSLGLHTN